MISSIPPQNLPGRWCEKRPTGGGHVASIEECVHGTLHALSCVSDINLRTSSEL